MLNNSLWVPLEEFAKDAGVSSSALRSFITELRIAPIFSIQEKECLFRDDVQELIDLVRASSKALNVVLNTGAQIRHRSGVEIWLSPEVTKCRSFGVALRNLWMRLHEKDSFGTMAEEYFEGSLIRCVNEEAVAFISMQKRRISRAAPSGNNAFARSVSYLGSKQPILDFVIEVTSRCAKSRKTKLLDPMCGSGVVSAAVSQFVCETYASDALDFCSNLALAINNSIDSFQVKALRDELQPFFENNYTELQQMLDYWVSYESELLVADPKTTLESYRWFISKFPRYPMGLSFGWNPSEFVSEARSSEGYTPYGLATAYFANAYFGVRQSMELDSIRFAIDRIDIEEKLKKQLLGALVITASRTASNYGGHFAQPRYIDPRSITESNISRLLDLRARSIWHEFLVRLEVLGAKGGDRDMVLHTLEGPWVRALDAYEQLAKDGDLVYIDPPYTREEASRYYHVLETLTKYNYPESLGKALAPPKGKDRFSSEFFTRSSIKFAHQLRCLLSRPLEAGFVVLWNYADNALCSIPEVLSELKVDNLRINGFFTQHSHRGQGQGRHRQVQEYILVLSARDNHPI